MCFRAIRIKTPSGCGERFHRGVLYRIRILARGWWNVGLSGKCSTCHKETYVQPQKSSANSSRTFFLWLLRIKILILLLMKMILVLSLLLRKITWFTWWNQWWRYYCIHGCFFVTIITTSNTAPFPAPTTSPITFFIFPIVEETPVDRSCSCFSHADDGTIHFSFNWFSNLQWNDATCATVV